MDAYLGLDLGTSATKTVAISADGEVLGRSRVEHPGARPGVGRADPNAWAASITSAVRALRIDRATIAGVGIDTHCPTMVPLDAEGRAAGLGVTWDHPRMATEFANRSDRRSDDAIAATGNHPAPSTTSALAYHVLAAEDPEAFAKMRILGFASTWLGGWLTGELGVDATQASYSGVFDSMAPAGSWLSGAANALDIPLDFLPPVVEPLAVLGQLTSDTAAQLGIAAGIDVVMGCADTPAAAFALGTKPGESPFIILGTTHVINNCLDEPDARAVALQRRGIRPGEWLINGVTNGGDAMGTAAHLFGFGSVKQMVALAATADADQIAQAPYFVGHVMPERGPLWLDEPATGLTRLNRATQPVELAYGIVEGVLLTDRMVLEATVPAWIHALRLTGAFGSDLTLPQAMADVMSRSFEIVAESDLPALGAAQMAATAAGHPQAPCEPLTTVSPDAVRESLIERRRAGFAAAWERATGRHALRELG